MPEGGSNAGLGIEAGLGFRGGSRFGVGLGLGLGPRIKINSGKEKSRNYK